MFLYTVLSALVGIAVGIFLAAHTKKAEGISYGRLDRAGKVTNIVLIPLYACPAPFFMFIGMLCSPARDGFMGVVGWVVSILIASATMLCGLGLGASVALRKKGKGRMSFAIQFLGVVAMILAAVLFAVCYGSLLETLN